MQGHPESKSYLQPNSPCESDAAIFYINTLKWLLESKVLSREMRLLVVCGSQFDRDILARLEFHTATITNLDTGQNAEDYTPYAVARQDAEALTFGDGEFDFCIAHNGLHHCLSPHRALLEMCRVAKSGAIVFEPRDSILTRLGVKLGLGQEYETAAVADHGNVAGGVRNSAIPNYVYRWTEREIEKTISSFYAWGRPRFTYRYALRVPWSRLRMLKNRFFYYLVCGLQPLLKIFFLCFPKQANGFAFIVLKPRLPEDLHHWLEFKNGSVLPNEKWVTSQYGAQKRPAHD